MREQLVLLQSGPLFETSTFARCQIEVHFHLKLWCVAHSVERVSQLSVVFILRTESETTAYSCGFECNIRLT